MAEVQRKYVWDLRGVQVDLARQMETVSYLCEFIDFIAEYNYNTLFLYLEGRIRTKSFPYPAVTESYTLEEMKEVVAYATSRNIDVVPILSTMGHAEKFLQFTEMEHLSEMREGGRGRFAKGGYSNFCPSLPESYDFFDTYIGELCQIFPSPYFHAGLDENWDMGFCSLCRPRADGEEGQNGIFAKHITDTHALLAKYGKRMIMWDDMFEFYEGALHTIPKDIIMCCWQYCSMVDVPKAHFANRRREDSLHLYGKLGFESLIGPITWMSRNVETFTNYASTKPTMGGLLTSWEKSCLFQWESYPTVAFAGRLWKNAEQKSAAEILNECLIDIFGISDPLFLNAARTFCETSQSLPNREVSKYLSGPVTELEFERALLFRTAYDILSSYQDQVCSPLAQKVLDDMLIVLRCCLVHTKLRECIPLLRAPHCEISEKKQAFILFDAARTELRKIKALRADQWAQFRGGITPCSTDLFYDKLDKDLVALIEGPVESLLNVHFVLPDMYSRQTVSFFVKYQGQSNWISAGSGVFKPDSYKEAVYQYSFTIAAGTPEVIRIETHGFGGQGFSSLDIQTADGTYVPVSIDACSGDVIFAENMLIPDLQWCFMGERDTTKAVLDPPIAEAEHILEIRLKVN